MAQIKEKSDVLVSKTVTIQRNREEILVVDTLENVTITLEEGAKLTYIYCGFDGLQQTKKITFEFAGREAELKFLGLIIGSGKNEFTFETISHHKVPQTKAHYFVRAAMFDHSKVDYKGNIIIEKPAQITDSYLAHHTLLLSDFARARTIPALEIEADDVKAGHAATIGKVDEEVMFYLQSRGIDKKQAEILQISGFFEQELSMISDPDLAAKIRQQLLSKLPF